MSYYDPVKSSHNGENKKKNNLDMLQAIKDSSGPLLGAAITIASMHVAQIVGQIGYQFVLIDMEHSPISAEQATNLVHTVVSSSRGSCLPLIRVPSQGAEWIKWALDSGASGIVVPMLESKQEMEVVVSRALYPPKGKRSFGPSRAPWGLPHGAQGGIGDYFRWASGGKVAIIPMIESAEGVRNVDEILGVDGVSGVFIGPMDLRLSLGFHGVDGLEPVYLTAITQIIRSARDCRRFIGTISLGQDEEVQRAIQEMDWLIVATDSGVLFKGLTSELIRSERLASPRNLTSL